jgi:hypothetical protein
MLAQRPDLQRLDAGRPMPLPPLGDNHPPPMYRKVCLECGDPFESQRTFGGFCCPAHRADFNNRRMKRGAEIYDLVMAWRYQRGLDRLLGLRKLVCRMAAAFREQDHAEREGRRSWRNPTDVIAERPWLHAVTIIKRRAKRPTANS